MAYKDEVGSLDRIASALENIGGGGGGGSSSLAMPHFTDNSGTITCDMTFEEIKTAVLEGKCHDCFYTETVPILGKMTSVYQLDSVASNSVTFSTIYIDEGVVWKSVYIGPESIGTNMHTYPSSN